MYKDPEKKFDIRVIKKNLAAGVVSQQEYEEHLANLGDVSSLIEETPLFSFQGEEDQDKEEVPS